MSKHLNAHKVLIISSVKSNLEFPLRLKLAKTTKAYKLIPMSLILNIESLAKFSFGEKKTNALSYMKVLSVQDIRSQLGCRASCFMDRTVIDETVIQHDMDDVFPIKKY
jgi:hypothetical protein